MYIYILICIQKICGHGQKNVEITGYNVDSRNGVRDYFVDSINMIRDYFVDSVHKIE